MNALARTLATLGAAALLVACSSPEPRHMVAPAPSSNAVTVAVEPREQLLPMYPCSRCHKDRPVNPQPRKLVKFHAVRAREFKHGDGTFWCYQCHSVKNIDKLRTATGELVSFNEAWKVCTSCHGDKLQPWTQGTHGLILGFWNGVKHKKSCPNCHNPHDPHPPFPPIKPQHPPQRPRE